MRSLRTVPFGAALVLSVIPLFAASPPDTAPIHSRPVDLLLRDRVRSVWKSSSEVAAANAELDAVQARARAAAQPLYNPSVSLEAENADVDRRTASVSLALDLSGKRRARSEQGNAQLRAGEATFDRVRSEVAGRWLKAWATTVLASRQSTLGAHRIELMQRFDDLAAERLKVGDISSVERDLAGLALGEAQLQNAVLAGQQAVARSTLVGIADEDIAVLPELPDRPPAIAPGFAAPTVDELPELREARARIDSADAGVRVAERARRPDPTLSLTGGQVRSGPLSDRVIGFSVSIPFPVLNTGRAEVDAARADADAASATLQSRRLQLRAAQQQTLVRYNALQSASDAFRTGRAGAYDERAALLEKLWRAGEIDTSDYLVQLRLSLDTALSGLELESQTWLAWFDYLAAAGRLVDWIEGRTGDPSP